MHRDSEGSPQVAERDLPFGLFIEAVKDYAIFMLDPSGYIVSWNVGAERLKGYAADEIIGQHFSVFYPAEDRAAGKPARVLAAAAADGRVEDEGWRVRKDGTRFWADVVVTAVRDTNGDLIGFGKVTRDMTDFRERRHALMAAVQELRSANEILETFTRSMTHDLRGPLRTMQGFADILQEDYADRLDTEGRDYLARIAAGAQRLSQLIERLLILFRMTSAGERPPLVPVSWDAVVADVLRDMPPDVEGAANIDVAAPLGAVLAYREFLTVIVENLLWNALKYVASNQRPVVHVFAERRGEWLRLTVADKGIGVPRDQQEFIFEAFKRLHTRAEYAGSGLGLAIVRSAVERLGGVCGVISEHGAGSRFWVDLRAAESRG